MAVRACCWCWRGSALDVDAFVPLPFWTSHGRSPALAPPPLCELAAVVIELLLSDHAAAELRSNEAMLVSSSSASVLSSAIDGSLLVVDADAPPTLGRLRMDCSTSSDEARKRGSSSAARLDEDDEDGAPGTLYICCVGRGGAGDAEVERGVAVLATSANMPRGWVDVVVDADDGGRGIEPGRGGKSGSAAAGAAAELANVDFLGDEDDTEAGASQSSWAVYSPPVVDDRPASEGGGTELLSTDGALEDVGALVEGAGVAVARAADDEAYGVAEV